MARVRRTASASIQATIITSRVSNCWATAQINPDDPEGVFQNVSNSVPYGKRYGTAAEVASLVMWLLSDESEYVSGANHLIDGALNAG